jgi:ABC-type lipoprotein release transport system permease subunit
VLGVLVTVPLTFLLNHSGITYSGGIAAEPIPLAIAYVPVTYAITMALLSLMAVAAAILPANRAARMNIPDALGHL